MDQQPRQNMNGTTAHGLPALTEEVSRLKERVAILHTQVSNFEAKFGKDWSSLETRVASNEKKALEDQDTNDRVSEALRELQVLNCELASPEVDPGAVWPANLPHEAKKLLKARMTKLDALLLERTDEWQARAANRTIVKTAAVTSIVGGAVGWVLWHFFGLPR
jgi:hypothetical protein